jgi:hypothetical protein
MKFTYGTFSSDVTFYVIDETFGLDAIDIDVVHNPLTKKNRHFASS